MHLFRRAIPTVLLAALLSAAGAAAGCGSDQTAAEPKLDAAMIRKLLGPPVHPSKASRPMVTVPRVVGVPEDRAVARLAKRGLHTAPKFPGTVGNPDLGPTKCYSYGSQGPPPGTRVPRGSVVSVTVVLCSEVNGQADRLSGHS